MTTTKQSAGASLIFFAVSLPAAFVLSILLCFEGNMSCSVDAKGDRTCTEKLTYNGWKGVPLEAMGGAVGAGFAAFKIAELSGGKLGKFVEAIGAIFASEEKT